MKPDLAGVPIERPRTINPQDKKLMVTQLTMALCDTWVQQGPERPSIEEVEAFLQKSSATIRDLLGWS